MNIFLIAIFFSIFLWSVVSDCRFLLVFLIILIIISILANLFKKKTKIFNNIFKNPENPTIRSIIKVDITRIDNFLKPYNIKNQTKITYTHVAIKALSQAIMKYKNINSYISYNQIFQNKSPNIAIVINVKEKDLVFKIVRKTDKMKIKEIPNQINKGIKSIKSQKNKKINLFNIFIKHIPSYLLSLMGRINFFIFHSFLARINLNIIQKNLCFAAITNVSAFNIYEATACHIELIKSSIVLLLGTPKKVPVVVNGKIVHKKIMNVGISSDQRLGTGDDFLMAVKEIKDVFMNFEKYF